MDIKNLIEQQTQYFNTNKTKDLSFRITQLKKLKSVLKANEEKLKKAIYADFGKSAHETYITELGALYHEINLLIKKLPKWSRWKRVPTGLLNLPGKSYIIPEPLGCTLVIGAWNYPYHLTLLPALTSLAAGNTVIMKPSEIPVNASNVLAELINNNFEKKIFHVVEGGVEVTTGLLNYAYSKIFFTGSIPVGKIVYQAAAKHLTPVTLELGGKSPNIVLPGANIKITAKRIVWAKFLNAGQTCIAPDYVLAHQSIEQELLQALKTEVENNYQIDNDIPENYLRIINDKNFDRLYNLIDKQKIYCGGHTNKEKRIITPTILHQVNFNDTIMHDEIFGPILPVISFNNIDNAIQQIKSRPKPLACYIYSNNSKLVKRILNEISFGGGCINEGNLHVSNSNLPFGGVGFSGIGSYHGKAGFDSFTHYKSILHKPFWFEPKLKYVPYTKQKLKIIQMLLGS